MSLFFIKSQFCMRKVGLIGPWSVTTVDSCVDCLCLLDTAFAACYLNGLNDLTSQISRHKDKTYGYCH